jgi:uncharacterized membrane protein SpoIIM required for sporulation
MDVEQFYRSRQAEWRQFSRLVERSEANAGQLSPDEVKAIGRLYRAVTSDLALAQRAFPRHRVTLYLNQLVARGHATIYRGEPLDVGRLINYVKSGFPRAYRQAFPFILAAMVLLLLPALAAGLATNWRPEASGWLLPAQVQELIPSIQERELWTDIPVEQRPYASSFIMTNNIRVSFMAFGGGVTAGLLTIYTLIFNGLLLGGLTGLTAHYDVGFELWTFVISHGVIELSTIFIAGGSGLMLGWAIIQPGLLRRRDALTLAARHAVRLIIGCVPLLVAAGLIEGFISPNEHIHWAIKWSIGVISGVALYGYLLLAGREGEERRPLSRLWQM